MKRTGEAADDVGGDAEPKLTMRFWISNIHAGTIIGKGGAHIKSMRESTNCHIMMAEALQPGAERLLTITGAPLSVHAAVDQFVSKIESCDLELNPPPPDPVQARIFAFLPIVFTFVLAGFAAGLVIYWAWNNFLTVLQQYVIMRRHGNETQLDKLIARLRNKASGSES